MKVRSQVSLFLSFLFIVLATLTLTGLVIRPARGNIIAIELRSDPAFLVINETVTFTANWTGGLAPYTFNLSFGDGSLNATGTTGTGNTGLFTVGHAYANAGNFFAWVTVKDSNGSYAFRNRPVTVRGILTTNFSSLPSTASFGDLVQFTGIVSNGTRTPAGTFNFTFNWDYGDGVKNSTQVSTTTDPSVSPVMSSTTHAMHASG